MLELCVFGFPKDTCEATILKIFRLFAPIYTVEKKENYALLYVSPEAGIISLGAVSDSSIVLDYATPRSRGEQLSDLLFVLFCLVQTHKPK